MVTATFDIEKTIWKKGKQLICGVDEVGRGCFAGPVVVGGVIFPANFVLPFGVADSKLLKPVKRDELAEEIKKVALCWGVAEVSVEIINNVGIGQATQIAFYNVVKSLCHNPDFILIDAFYIKALSRENQMPIVNGDKLSASIASASIIAKVHRDNIMTQLDLEYPDYGFATHKGYGTKAHQEAIREHGLSEIHRSSFDLSKFLG